MITVLVIIWYGDGNQQDAYIKAKKLVIKSIDPICLETHFRDLYKRV
jgi:hypothetical protein